MNDWPPPSVDDAPAVSPTATVATPWWRRPLTQGILVAWVLSGMLALAVITVRSVRGDDPRAISTVPTASLPPSASTQTGAVDVVNDPTGTPTTEPQVRSAPPVPPRPDADEPSTQTTLSAATTTIVVTLPPTTTVVPTLPAPADPTVDIAIRFDADGDDAENLNDEWVRFINAGPQTLDLTNWIVRDDGLAHAHVFGPLTLAPGAAVTLYSGCGNPTGSERFFCTTDPEVWDNDGDVVSLFDESGRLISQRRG